MLIHLSPSVILILEAVFAVVTTERAIDTTLELVGAGGQVGESGLTHQRAKGWERASAVEQAGEQERSCGSGGGSLCPAVQKEG